GGAGGLQIHRDGLIIPTSRVWRGAESCYGGRRDPPHTGSIAAVGPGCSAGYQPVVVNCLSLGESAAWRRQVDHLGIARHSNRVARSPAESVVLGIAGRL